MNTITTPAEAKTWLDEYILYQDVKVKFVRLLAGAVPDPACKIGDYVTDDQAEEYFERACQAAGMPRAKADAIHELGPGGRRAMLNKVADLTPGLTPSGRRRFLREFERFADDG
jgi:hypothetical protein